MEATKGGFIKLYRSIGQHWLWDDPQRLKWWLDILLEVNYIPKKASIGNRLIMCDRGQVLYSLATWAKRWRVDVSKVRRFLYLLKSDGMIETENVGKTTRITVCNYDSYNDWRHESDTKVTGKRHESDAEAPTIEEIKETKNNDKGALPCLSLFNEENAEPVPAIEKPVKPAQKRFIPPTEEELAAYIKERGLPSAQKNALKFLNSYEQKGWMVGKNKMKCWRTAVRNWEINGWFIMSQEGGQARPQPNTYAPGGQVAPGTKLKFK